ncbi:hypothetical protein ISF_06373 [Cordyceps fumosorosea ARSEF 2679]|uniref:Uncharacterized protein n=1 Tax=Cordyceps fumosorosea (strain ARSEF 2679) TaxID=1081104 RepID=A0A167SAZ2_CORFA|nr:hypothetical protein ISF_06373 [Cordyceps fumosorosea ARSEF 2679]OAA59438.1 hypothetical protein ISF_06373 [Cordyceps fumosorosea ARSEF 2679]
MAAEQLSGARGIRSLTDQDASGLHAILGDPNSPNQQGSPTDMAIHARIFYYTQRVGVSIDFAAYQAWLAAHPDHTPPGILPPEYLGGGTATASATASAAPVLDWQKAAPKTELYVDRTAAAAAAAAAAAGDQPSYPMAFAEMIKLLQEGKEVPGIRQIPNTIIRDPAVKPVGARTVPRKPWEKNVPAPSDDTYRLAALDTEFPPVDSTSGQPGPEAV